MTQKSDRQLGMGRAISRRDFVQGSSVGTDRGAGRTTWRRQSRHRWQRRRGTSSGLLPPTRTGMRGSHPGSYEVAHALARQGAQFDDAVTPVRTTMW